MRDAPGTRRSEFCLNCGTATPDNFCPHCGQRNTHYRVSTWELMGEAAGELFQLDSRVLATVGTLLWRPGRLTTEYVAGRRVSYSSPLRLYLVTSLLYFLVLSLFPFLGENRPRPVPPAAKTSTSDIKLDVDIQKNPWLRRAKERWDTFQAPTQIEGKDRFVQAVVAHAPSALFMMVPVFALILKLAYVRRRRYYSEHLVFALHVHSFAFIALAVATLIHRGKAIAAASALTLVHLFLAQRRVYGQSRFRTFLKWSLVLFFYFWAMLIGVVVAVLLAFAFG